MTHKENLQQQRFAEIIKDISDISPEHLKFISSLPLPHRFSNEILDSDYSCSFSILYNELIDLAILKMPSIEAELLPLKSTFDKLKKIFVEFGEPDKFISNLIFDLTSMFQRLQHYYIEVNDIGNVNITDEYLYFPGFEKMKLITQLKPMQFTIAVTKPSKNLRVIMHEMKCQFDNILLDIVQKYGYMK